MATPKNPKHLRKTITLKSATKHKTAEGPALQKASSGSGSSKGAPSGSRATPQKKSLEDILLGTFVLDKEGSAGRGRRAKVSKADLKTISTLARAEKLPTASLDKLCSAAQVTDPTLACLTEVLLHGMGEGGGATGQKVLLDTCVRIASGVWINSHQGSLDLYSDFFEGQLDASITIRQLDRAISASFEKRIASPKRSLPATRANDVSGGIESNISILSKPALSRKELEAQKRNLLLVGVFWLLEKRKITLDDAVEHLFELIEQDAGTLASLRVVSVCLGIQALNGEPQLGQAIAMLRRRITHAEDEKRRIEALSAHKERQLGELQETVSRMQLSAERSRQQAADFEGRIRELEEQLRDQDLDGRATRTHLRDSEGKVRARAFNLLSEDVLGPLRLALAALRRDRPKAEVAAHQVELAVESIEGDLQWFKV